MLNGLGIETGVDLGTLMETGEWISSLLGRPTSSKVFFSPFVCDFIPLLTLSLGFSCAFPWSRARLWYLCKECYHPGQQGDRNEILQYQRAQVIDSSDIHNQ